MKKFLKSSEGFTLVELMVVVAIIGILSAVAIPNFKKYQAKSKQSEAKIQLAALYTAEVTANSDYDTYASCLALMGYETIPKGYYIVGFKTGFDATAVNANFAGCNASATYIAVPSATNGHISANGAPVTVLTGAEAALQNSFVAGAEGTISSGGANARDVWQITQTKALTNPTPGI